MDPQKIKDVYDRLELLDERMTHRVRPRPGGALMRLSTEQLEEKLRDLAAYTVELRELVKELVVAIAAKAGGTTPG